jgi:hypothetical protein
MDKRNQGKGNKEWEKKKEIGICKILSREVCQQSYNV